MNPLLQPEDSKRVADLIIKKIEEGDFDMADGAYGGIQQALSPGVEGINISICDAIREAIIHAIGGMTPAVTKAIGKGIDKMPAPQ